MRTEIIKAIKCEIKMLAEKLRWAKMDLFLNQSVKPIKPIKFLTINIYCISLEMYFRLFP
jgi:hypothetical protein